MQFLLGFGFGPPTAQGPSNPGDAGEVAAVFHLLEPCPPERGGHVFEIQSLSFVLPCRRLNCSLATLASGY
jgi:hypothetical protein